MGACERSTWSITVEDCDIHTMIDSKPTRRLIEIRCKFTFSLLANVISSYIPSDLGSQIVNFLQIYTAFCGIHRVVLNHLGLRLKYTPPICDTPVFYEWCGMCSIALRRPNFFRPQSEGKTKTGQRIFVNFAKFAWIFAKFTQIRVGVFVNPPA